MPYSRYHALHGGSKSISKILLYFYNSLAPEQGPHSLRQFLKIYFIFTIGRVRKIAVEKGRPSTSGLITGVPPVTFCAGSSESDHSGT